MFFSRLSGALLGITLLSGCASAQRHTRHDPQLVALDAALGNTFMPAATRSSAVARIHLRTLPGDPSRRPPVNIALVVDTSGSMEGRAIEEARRASLALLDTLGNEDRFSLVAYHARAEVLVPSCTLDREHREEARRHISAVRAQGTTDLAGGLRLGLQQLGAGFLEHGVNRIVLLGDGVPNDATGIEDMAAAAAQRGITITTFGLGTDYNETLMGAIAQRSGGRFHYLADPREMATVFREEVLRSRRVLARNAVVQLTPGPDVQLEAVVGQAAVPNGNGVQVTLGDLAEGETRDLIVRMSAAGRRNGAVVELLDAELTFEDTVNDAGRLERHAYLGAHATTDDAELTRGRNEDVERTAAQLQLAAGTVAAIAQVRSGDLAAAQQQVDELLAQARTAREEHPTAEVQSAYRQLDNLRSVLGRRRPTGVAVSNAPAATTPSTYGGRGRGGAGGPARVSAPPPASPPVQPAAPEAPSEVDRATINSVHDDAVRTLQGI
jgi:Ca-activated chloride channel family protein